MTFRKFLFLTLILIGGLGMAQNKKTPTSYIFFNQKTDLYSTGNLEQFQITAEDGEILYFEILDLPQRESSIANLRITNRTAIKKIKNQSKEIPIIVIKKENLDYHFFPVKLIKNQNSTNSEEINSDESNDQIEHDNVEFNDQNTEEQEELGDELLEDYIEIEGSISIDDIIIQEMKSNFVKDNNQPTTQKETTNSQNIDEVTSENDTDIKDELDEDEDENLDPTTPSNSSQILQGITID